MAQKLNTTSEWERIVNDNHSRVASAEFEREMAGLNHLIAEDTSGKDREGITMKLEANRPGMIAKLAMACSAITIFVAGIVNLEINASGYLAGKPVIGLIAMSAGIVTGMCLGKKKH